VESLGKDLEGAKAAKQLATKHVKALVWFWIINETLVLITCA
jgi:hypothetical protein